MPVDPQWLAQIRAKNRAKFGFASPPVPASSSAVPSASLEGLGYVSSQDLVRAMNIEREARTASLHAGRLEKKDPTRPEPGSIESIAQAIAPTDLPTPQPVPKGVWVLTGVAGLGALALLAYAIWKRSS